MAENQEILTLTMNPSLDISAEVDRVAATMKMRCDNDRIDPGGGGINVSRAIHILGGSSLAVFPAGGSTGKILIDMLKEQGVDNRPVTTELLSRQSFAVRERETNQQYRFSMSGHELPEQTSRECLQMITQYDPPPSFVVVSGSLPPGVPDDFYGKLANHFRQSRTKIILDTSGEPLKKALKEQVYLIKPNQRELEYVCDCSLAEENVQNEKCREIIEKGYCEALVLTLGKKGALLTTKEGQYRIPGIEVKEVSAVGAGDSFVGGMVLALQQGKKLPDAFLYAMAAGASALTTEATALC
ncbi:MAG: 1-phosphofructokinase family hexose kinase, partial [Desulforhopalus sp.]